MMDLILTDQQVFFSVIISRMVLSSTSLSFGQKASNLLNLSRQNPLLLSERMFLPYFMSLRRFRMVWVQQNRLTPFLIASSEKYSSAYIALSISYSFQKGLPYMSVYEARIFTWNFGSSFLSFGVNFTKIKPPFVQTYPCLFSSKAEGKPLLNFVTVNLLPQTGYFTLWSTDPKTVIPSMSSDSTVISTSWTHTKKVQSNWSTKQVCRSEFSTAQRQLNPLTWISFQQVLDLKSVETPMMVVETPASEISLISFSSPAIELSPTSVSMTILCSQSFNVCFSLNWLMFFKASMKPVETVVPPDSNLVLTCSLTLSRFNYETNQLGIMVLAAVWKITSEKTSSGFSFSSSMRMACLERVVLDIVSLTYGSPFAGSNFKGPSIDPDTSSAMTRFSGRVLASPSVELFIKRLMKQFLPSMSQRSQLLTALPLWISNNSLALLPTEKQFSLKIPA